MTNLLVNLHLTMERLLSVDSMNQIAESKNECARIEHTQYTFTYRTQWVIRHRLIRPKSMQNVNQQVQVSDEKVAQLFTMLVWPTSSHHSSGCDIKFFRIDLFPPPSRTAAVLSKYFGSSLILQKFQHGLKFTTNSTGKIRSLNELSFIREQYQKFAIR